MLHVSIPSWYHGRAGRYQQEGTARKHVLTTRTLPGLRWGKLPTADDYKAFTLGRCRDLEGGDKAWLKEWANTNRPDVRKKAKESRGMRQTTLEYAAASGSNYGRRAGGRGGRPRSYRFDWGPTEGKTLGEVSRMRGPLGTFSCGGAFIVWLGGSKFTWEFPQHLQLFVELQDLEIRGYAMTASRLEGSKGGGKMHCLKIAKSQTDRFEQYVNRGDPWMDDALLVAAARAKDGGAMGAGGVSVEEAKARVKVR